MSGPPLGRPRKNLSKELKKQAQESERIRNEIEGKFGIGKRRFSLNRVMTKLDQTSLTAIAITFLVMNFSYLLRQVYSHFLCQISPTSYFREQEESYTSKVSALDLDEIPVYGEKPEGWKPLGKRVKRGLYQSADGTQINADCNGSWNIGRKAKVVGMQCKPSRGHLTSPKRLRIWNLRSAEISPEESPSL